MIIPDANIRLLNDSDTQGLKTYLEPNQAECMFIYSNLNAGGIEYGSEPYQGEYYGYFNDAGSIRGVIVHYWNNNIMMHAENDDILGKLASHMKKHIKRPLLGIQGANISQAIMDKISKRELIVNANEGLYRLNLGDMLEPVLPANMTVASARDVDKSTVFAWMKEYDIESLKSVDNEELDKLVQQKMDLRLERNDCWILFQDMVPVALSAFNARTKSMVQIGPVYTPPLYRNKGFARTLLAYTLWQERQKGTEAAILFTDNPAGARAYTAIGFIKIGHYRFAIFANEEHR